MKKFGVFVICLSSLIALFSVNNLNKDFSFENYLNNVAMSAENRPKLPSTEYIENALVVYEFETEQDFIDTIVLVCQLLYGSVIVSFQYLGYFIFMVWYVLKIVFACTYNLLVW